MFGAELRCSKCNQYKPDRCTCDKPGKGLYDGRCNRMACQQPGAVWYNHSTRKYYCEECAHELNRYNRRDSMELFGHDLCTKGLHEGDVPYKKKVLLVDDNGFADLILTAIEPPDVPAEFYFGEKKGRRRGQRNIQKNWR